MRKALALAGLLVLTACGKQDADGIAPAGNIAVTDVLTRDALTLGPDGHAVELGASEAEVTAAGWTVGDQTAAGRAQACPKTAAIQMPNGEDGTLAISVNAGVSHISAGGDMHTPEGVRIHSLAADVMRAYPEVKVPAQDTDLTVPVPGNPQASYVIKIHDGQVIFLDLKLNDTDC